MIPADYNNIQTLSREQLQADMGYMRRCLQLARGGERLAQPNPMVGAVIVSRDGRIIGEGYHVRCGEGHAEVNAFASVSEADEWLLPEATLYVSLEPCSHWGKTPPCADLIVRKGVRRVVCGCIDPFAQVQGRGVEHLRQAGIEVTVGVLESDCQELNRRFMQINKKHRPYVILKWAQTADGFLSMKWENMNVPVMISSHFTRMLVHKLRSEVDAIVVGRNTLRTDRPRLDVRHWAGESPVPMVLSHYETEVPEGFLLFHDIDSLMMYLVDHKMQSLLVEGGAETLQEFLDRDLWDEIRVETAMMSAYDGVPAPHIPRMAHLASRQVWGNNTVDVFEKVNGLVYKKL